MNIVEKYRELLVENLFTTTSFNNVWSVWEPLIKSKVSTRPNSYYDLGDKLRDIFKSTGQGGRAQGNLSASGNVWESLVAWYLNLVTIGRRTVVIKFKRSLVPEPVQDAITITYNNFDSNTESDLLAITFPDESDFNCDFTQLQLLNEHDEIIPVYKRNGEANVVELMNALCDIHFANIEIHIIQCKTNWNDNAQIPMLWDMVYSAQGFGRNINVGKNGRSIRGLRDFSYSFVTVPSNDLSNFTPTSTAVMRVSYLSGGNYWGVQSRTAVARSVKELATQNLSSGHDDDIAVTLAQEIPNLQTDYAYFRLT